MSESYLLFQVLLLCVLLTFSAFFSGAETAIFSLSNLAKKRLKTRHPLTWKTIEILLEQPRRTLITILIGNLVVSTLAVTIATNLSLRLFGPAAVGWEIGIFTIILMLIGEITPKTLAVQYNEWFAFLLARPLDFFAKLFFPIRKIVRWISDSILSFIIHEKQTNADLVSEAELKALARIGEEEGALKTEERRMIQKLIGLGERTAKEIMTPRPDLIAFDLNDPIDRLIEILRQHHFSHMPVYRESIDKLVGVISAREFMLQGSKELEGFIQKPYYIPETKPVDELFEEFKTHHISFAICIDEYGSTAGLVTFEDILEEIFGEFYDEYSKDETPIRQIEKGHYLVNGKVGIHELSELLGITLESENSETLNGWILEQLGKIPNSGESFKWRDIHFLIKDVHHQRILKVEIWTRK